MATNYFQIKITVIMPTHRDVKLLFSFDFLVERLTFVDIECSFPGVTFNLLDFPLVLVEPPLRSLQHPCRMNGENERCVTVKFNRGKSCRFEMRLKDLVESLKKSAVQVALVDLVKNNSNVPKVLGTAVLDLCHTASSLQKPAIENGEYSAGERQEIAILEASNKKIVAKAHIRYHFKTSLTHQENMACFEETSVTIPIHTHESRDVSTTAVLQPLSGPNQHSSSVNKSHLHDTEHMATSSSPAGSDTSSMSESRLSPEVVRTDPLNNDCELLYLPNSVCPPPLFYQHQPGPYTDPSNRGVGEWIHETSGDLFVGNDTAMDHWSVLMAHDHCSHPVTVKQNATENTTSSQELPSNQVAALPLLSALLEELLLLKSHAESTPPLEVAASLLHRREPEKATKCLQTDESLTTSVSQPAKKNILKSVTARVILPPQSTWNIHHRHTRFVRECCIQKRANSSTALVPRNESVIYPPDIVHKRRKAVGLRNKAPLHTRFDLHKEDGCGAKSKVAKLVPKCDQKPLVSSPLQNEEKSEMLPSPDCNQGEVRKVEVFIPQATYVAGSTEDSPLSGSVASLHKVHVDAETQTAMTDSLQFEPSKDHLQTEHVRPSDGISPLLLKSTVQSNDMNRDPESARTESLASQTDRHSNTQEAKQDVSLQPSGVSIMIAHAYKDGSPSQECASPNVVVHRRASIGFPMGSKQNNSLLNIAASQTLDSFLSVDSLDVADSTVLPKHRKEGFVYLASSQSSGSDHDLAADEHDSDHSYTQEYSDDFEELESSSSSM